MTVLSGNPAVPGLVAPRSPSDLLASLTAKIDRGEDHRSNRSVRAFAPPVPRQCVLTAVQMSRGIGLAANAHPRLRRGRVETLTDMTPEGRNPLGADARDDGVVRRPIRCRPRQPFPVAYHPATRGLSTLGYFFLIPRRRSHAHVRNCHRVLKRYKAGGTTHGTGYYGETIAPQPPCPHAVKRNDLATDHYNRVWQVHT